jgi:nitrous oxidase accessory protein NosD
VLGGTGWASLAAPAAQASTAPCTVADQATHASYTSLQDAEAAASPGDTLSVTGTCTGTTEITKNLTITGRATLDGNQENRVLIFDSGVTVTISSLTITGGRDALSGGGIFNNGGTVTLTGGSTINGNTASSGGGIDNGGGTVTLTGGSRVTGNKPDNCAPPGSVSGCSG